MNRPAAAIGVLALGVCLAAAGARAVAAGEAAADPFTVEAAGLPPSWGGPALSEPAAPPRPAGDRVPAAPAAPAASAASLAGAGADSLAPADPAPADQVSAVTVRAPDKAAPGYTPGPAWWKLVKGDRVAWIMATPDEMPLDTAFDDGPLGEKIAAAHALIVPAEIAASKPPAPPDRFTDMTAPTPLRLPSAPLSARLSPPLYARLAARLDLSDLHADDDLQGVRAAAPLSSLNTLQQAPMVLSSVEQIASRLARSLNLPGVLGNPAVDRAVDLAERRARPVAVDRLANSAADILEFPDFYEGDEAAQEACLGRVLDALDADLIGPRRLDAVADWAQGDADRAAKRLNVMSLCDYGEPGRRFWTGLVDQYVEALDRALSQPGQVVAIVEFDPLEISGGVLDAMRKQGYGVTPP